MGLLVVCIADVIDYKQAEEFYNRVLNLLATPLIMKAGRTVRVPGPFGIYTIWITQQKTILTR